MINGQGRVVERICTCVGFHMCRRSPLLDDDGQSRPLLAADKREPVGTRAITRSPNMAK